MEKTLYTTGNIKAFFHTETAGLPGAVVPLVTKFNESFGSTAYALVESAQSQPELVSAIIPGMIQNYSGAVKNLICGWGRSGNA